MNSRKWCVISVCAVLSAILSVIILNIAVDPFGVWGNEWYSYNFTNNPRVAKIEYLKKNHSKYDSYIIGCSSTSSYPVSKLNEYMDADFYNLVMYGADMYDVEKMAYYVGDNYEVKNIVVNVYLANGLEFNTEPDKLLHSLHSDVSGESKLSFYSKYAFANPQYAISKIKAKKNDRYLSESFDVFDEKTGAYDKRKRDAESVSDLESFYNDYPGFLNYPHTEAHLLKYNECAESLKRIKKYCEEKNINFYAINGPVYYEYLHNFPENEVKQYYKALADATDFWDFSISSVSLEPRFFYDETHFRNDVGEMALARMFGDKSVYIPEDFGTYITKENVSEYVNSFYGKTFSDKEYTKKLPVLMYHHIADEVTNDMIVSPETFEKHMKAIWDNGYTAVTIDEVTDYIERGKNLPEKSVMITFDDGYMSNYEYAYPILEKYGLNAVIFAVGETYGKDVYPDTDKKIYPHFGEKERNEMEKSGVIDVQSHGYAMHQNPDYKEGVAYENMLKLPDESDEEYVLRLKNDWEKWSKLMKKSPIAVAFPYGKSDLLAQAVLNDCGVKLTFSTTPEASTIIKGIKLSGYSLGRFTINNNVTEEELLKLISNN